MTNSFKILIVGCGELGSRHLQAVCSLSQVKEVVVVDPNPASLELGKNRLQDIADVSPETSFRWLASLNEVQADIDLCIVATLARRRGVLIEEIAEKVNVSRFLVEKIVSQSVLEYENLFRFVESKNLSVWVNCNTRGFDIHRYIKKKIQPGESIIFKSVGGNHGLANNGIHTSDLFLFYDGSEAIEPVAQAIDPILHSSKRGQGYFDLSGTLQGRTKKGNHFSLSFARDHVASEHISIVTKSYRCVVDHLMRWACENEGENAKAWKLIPFEGGIFVSQTTKKFATDILTKGSCELPTLKECYPAHQFILESLLPYFNQFLKKTDDICPVT